MKIHPGELNVWLGGWTASRGPHGELLGTHLVGAGVAELLPELTLAQH